MLVITGVKLKVIVLIHKRSDFAEFANVWAIWHTCSLNWWVYHVFGSLLPSDGFWMASGFYEIDDLSYADLNEENNVDILDVISLVTIILDENGM